MSSAPTSRPLRASLLLLPLTCALLFSAPAAAMSGGGELSPKLTELARPSVESLPPARQDARLGLPASGPGSLVREGDRVLVDVSFAHGALAALGELRAAGARIVAASRRYQTVTVSVLPSSLHDLPPLTGVANVSENRAPLVYAEGPVAGAVGADCEGGSVISEGVQQLNVDDARGKYDVTGSGVTVGVLSNSFDKGTQEANGSGPIATHAGGDVESGDLPGSLSPCAKSEQKTPVRVLEDFSGSKATDEGRAMLQIVHDVAPDAKLAFATAFKSETAFAENIERLAKPVSQGGAAADVIVDDVVWFGEPFFQDGPVATAVNKVVGDGVAYFSSAGNDNLFEGANEIASWETPSFRETTCPATVQALLPSSGHCMDFNPGGGTDNTFGIKVGENATLTVDLQWAEPWYGVHTDLDAYLLDSTGKLLEKEDQNNAGALKPKEGGTQKPVEALQWENKGPSQQVQLVINRCFAECNPEADETKLPRVKFALLQNGGGVSATEYPTSSGGDVVGPTIFGHTASNDAVSVAAIRYNTTTQPEQFSSRGPVKHYFGPVVGKVAAAAVPEETIEKPNVTATDCGETTFFAIKSGTKWRFCGTSAAAPHAAGIAALELQAEPAASVSAIRGAQEATALPVGSFGPNAVGAGLLDADTAVASLLPPSPVALTGHPANRTNDTTPTFEFSPTPASACLVDGSQVKAPCDSPFTVEAPLGDGEHEFTVEDGGGEASFTFTVDTTPPVVQFVPKPDPVTANRTPSLGFAASEPSEFECSLDGAAAQPCASPYKVASPLADGGHTLRVQGTDQAGNEGEAEAKFTVDTVAPTVKITRQPPAEGTEAVPAFEFSASEPASFTCAIDGVSPQFCASPFVSPRALADGSHTFSVTATDPAGNAGTASASFDVDRHPPKTFFAKHPRHLIRTKRRRVRVAFRFGSNEPGATFICKVDRGLLRFCGPTIVRRFEEGAHVVVVKARDAVGNVDRTPAVFHFRVKRSH